MERVYVSAYGRYGSETCEAESDDSLHELWGTASVVVLSAGQRVTSWLTKVSVIAAGVATVDHSPGDIENSGIVTVISTVEVWLGPSGNVRVRIEIASVSMGLGTVTVTVSGSGAAVTAAADPKVTESSDTVMVTTDCAAELSTGKVVVLVEKAVSLVTVIVRGSEVLWVAGPAVSGEVQDDDTEPGWPDGKPRDEELAEMTPGRALDVRRTDEALAVLEAIVTVTSLGIGDDSVTEPVTCPRAVVEQLELARAVVAGSRVVVNLGSTAVASTASVLEQVVSKASSLADKSVVRSQIRTCTIRAEEKILTGEAQPRMRPAR